MFVFLKNRPCFLTELFTDGTGKRANHNFHTSFTHMCGGELQPIAHRLTVRIFKVIINNFNTSK